MSAFISTQLERSGGIKEGSTGVTVRESLAASKAWSYSVDHMKSFLLLRMD